MAICYNERDHDDYYMTKYLWDSSAKGTRWYNWLRSNFEKPVSPATQANKLSLLGVGTCLIYKPDFRP